MAINQFTQPRKAWIIIDDETSNCTVVFKDPLSNPPWGSIPKVIQVEFTPQQAKFVRKFQQMQEKYNNLCESFKP